MNFRTPYNYKSGKGDHEKKSKLPSLTEPDLNLTVREILTRFTSGNLPQIQHEKIDEAEINFDDYLHIHDLDYDMADATRDKLRLMEIKQDVDKAIEAKLKKRQEKLDKEKLEFEEFKKQKESEKKKPDSPK